MNTRLNGFTLFELIAAMALSAIVISLVYTGVNALANQLIVYKRQSAFLYNADRGITLLERDFSLSRTAKFSSSNVLYLHLNENYQLRYEFSEDYLVRQIELPVAGPRDTFPLPTSRINFEKPISSNLSISDFTWHFIMLNEPKTKVFHRVNATFDQLK